MMKRKLISLVLLLALIVSMAVPSMAVTLETETEIQPLGINELNVRLAVNNYFDQRWDYLAGNADTISVTVAPVVTDEAAHKAALTQAGITLVESAIAITAVECWDGTADVAVTETLTLTLDGETIQQNVLHDITIFMRDNGELLVGRDGYCHSAFTSASYVPPEAQIAEYESAASTGGSGLCIIAVANEEVGTTENSDGSTEYGIWYGDKYNDTSFYTADWCAMFVAWCANNANISESTIACTASVPTMRTFFNNLGRYYLSSAWGGTYTPQAGDLFFQNDSPTSPDHIGIVESVSNGYIYVIDGNSSNMVRSRSISLTDTSLVAFARPNYTSTSHEYPSTYQWDDLRHWRVCENCGLGKVAQSHTLTTEPTTGEAYCTVCPYGWNSTIQRETAMVTKVSNDDVCCEEEQ